MQPLGWTHNPDSLAHEHLDWVDESAPSKTVGGIRGPLILFLIMSITILNKWAADANSELTIMALASQLIVAFLGIVVIISVSFKNEKLVITSECVLYMLFFTWIIAGIPFSLNGPLTQHSAVTLFKVMLMYLIVVNVVHNRAVYYWFLWSLMITVVGSLIIAESGLVHPYHVSGRYAATYANPNEFAIMLTLATWAAAIIALTTSRVWIIAICSVLIIVNMGFIGGTGSRMGMLSLMVLLAGTYWFALRKSKISMGAHLGILITVLLALVGLVGYLMTTEFWDRMISMVETFRGTGDESSAASRLYFIRACLDTFIENPIMGIGYAGMRVVLGGGLSMKSPHNSIATIAAETGILGWLMYFGAWGVLLLRIRRVEKLLCHSNDRVVLNMSWAIMCCALLWSFCGEMHLNKIFWTLFAAILGYTIWLEQNSRAKASESSAWESR